MIANKANHVSLEMALDSVVWPTEQSFFGSDGQLNYTSTQSYITPQSPQLVTGEDDWLQGFEVFTGLCDGIDLSLNYEPLGAMTKEADNQCQSKGHEFADYLDSTAFLSPQSMEAFSPKTLDDNHFETELDFAAQDLNTTSAMTILEEILSSSSSANSTDTEDCVDAELDLQAVTEVSKDWQTIDTTLIEMSEEKPKRRQTKRKAKEVSEPKPKANKRSKKTVNEKKDRKRDQNKSAANRYRIKKRQQLESIDDLQSQFAETNEALKAQLQKLQMEFRVVLPLAKAAFAADTKKSNLLEIMDIKVFNHNLLD